MVQGLSHKGVAKEKENFKGQKEINGKRTELKYLLQTHKRSGEAFKK